jgi:hypothetical protein
MKYLIIDASLNCTGIRDYYEGGYINPADLHLSYKTIQHLNDWLARYENEHYYGFKNNTIINKLDIEGKEIAFKIKNELSDIKIAYYSDARLTKELL